MRPAIRITRLAPLAMLPASAWAVHQLRYLFAYGGRAGLQLERTGHAYLHSLVPWAVSLIALLAGGFLRALGRACAGQRSLPRYTISLVGLWLACAATLVAIFAGQELLEGLLATGHPAGLAAVFGYGGWWAIPASMCVGLVIAAVLHGARWALDAIARRAHRPRPGTARAAAPPRPPDVLLARAAPLADGWSDRGPPR